MPGGDALGLLEDGTEFPGDEPDITPGLRSEAPKARRRPGERGNLALGGVSFLLDSFILKLSIQ